MTIAHAATTTKPIAKRAIDFDPENRSDVDDVTALLLQHVRQNGGDPVEESFDIDVNLAVPFLYPQSLDRCDGHDPGVIEEHIDAATTIDGPLDERFHFCAFGHIGGKSDGLAARGRDLLDHCVDPVRAPRS